MNPSRKSGALLAGLQSIQWSVFLLTNIIAVPIVVGSAFHMSAADIATFMQHMLFVTGAATLVQVLFGHRLPVAEGAAGMWWALFILLGAMTLATERGHLLQQLEMGMMVAGVILALISFLPIIVQIRELFTPIVTGVYLILLVCQMSGPFFKSMLGISLSGHLDGRVIGLSLGVVLVILVMSLKAKGVWRSMGPLFGIIVGWICFHVFGFIDTGRTPVPTVGFVLPRVFDWGAPQFNGGIVVTSVLTALILISNIIASILVVGIALERTIKPNEIRKGIFGNGVNLVLCGVFSVVGVVPLSVSGGFISTTGIKSKFPFIIGAILITVTGFFPYIGHFFATLPLEVAYASLFIPFAQMMGFGVRDLMGEEPSQRNLLVIGLSLMVGIGMMFVPPQALEDVSPWLRNILANGLLIGLLVCLFLEHVAFRSGKAARVSESST